MKLMIQWAVTSSVLILIVLAVRYLFRDKLSARLRYALWGVVLLRLLVPFQVELPAGTSGAIPVLASNLAQEVTPWLDHTMLYAVPTKDQPSDPVPTGRPPEFRRNGFPHSGWSDILSPDWSGWEYYSGGLVYDGNSSTRYAFMMTPLEVLAFTWIAGTALAAPVILLSNLRFAHRLRKRRRPLEGTDAPIPVYVAEGLPSPCLFGVLRPAVYVTRSAAERPDTLRHVLAHELTHYRHRDHIWSLLRCLALALHWYNPLVWLSVVLSKGDGELACDEGAVARLGETERIPYGRTLVDMVAVRSLHPADLLSCSTAMTGGGRSIQQRVARLVKHPETVRTALFAAVAVVALSAVFTFTGREEQQPDLYRAYKRQVDGAQAVCYAPSLISSQAYPFPITDRDLLEAALEILDSAADLLNIPEELDLSEAPFLSSRITLLKDPDDSASGQTYLLYTDRSDKLTRCYLVTPADLSAEVYTPVAVLDSSAKGALESLARQQSYRELENLTPAAFDYNQYHSQLSAAQGIWLNGTMLHNGHVLTDTKRLERLKELLVLTRVSDPPEWDGLWSDSIAFSTGLPDLDWTGADTSNIYYIVLTDEDFCYVCSDDGEEGGYVLGTVSMNSWEQARKILSEAPTVDDRQHQARNATYEGFLDLVEGAASIQVEAGDGTKRPAITDPEQLELARTALLTADPLPKDASDLVGASENWLRQEAGTDHYAITLTPEAGDPVTYYINRVPSDNTNYIIFPIKEFPVANNQTECTFDRIGVLHGPAGYALWIADNVAAGRFEPPAGLAEPDLSGLTIHR